jgi:glycosyltransferase involved in cell wall biosynthesis
MLIKAFMRIRAFATAAGDFPSPLLFIAGGFGWQCTEERDLIEMACPEGVRYLGYVSDDKLDSLYENALFVVYPSAYEGFGFPVLEALQRGIPVLTFRNSSLIEIGTGAVLFARTPDELGLYHSMKKLLSSPMTREILSNRGMSRASQYSWEIYRRELGNFLVDLRTTPDT